MAITALELHSVTKSFGATVAVSHISLAIQSGEIFGLIGPNGAGKTTTIKMICGLYRPTKGSVRVAGFDIAKDPTKAKWHLGYVPDEPTAYDRLSGREFLEFVGELYGMDRKERDARIEMFLARYGLERLADGRFGQYSRGTRQKISLIAGMLHQPALLLVDEPMVGLDPESIRTTIAIFREHAVQGGAVLISTHTLHIAEELCTRFGILREGKLVETGTRDEIRQKAGLKRGDLEDAFLKLT
jgi:ABC-2 type transport system ATP-binding protein